MGTQNLFQVDVFNQKDHPSTPPPKDSNMSQNRKQNKTSHEKNKEKERN